MSRRRGRSLNHTLRARSRGKGEARLGLTRQSGPPPPGVRNRLVRREPCTVPRMPLLTLIIVIVVIGVVLYLIETYIPMSPPIRTVLRVVVVLALVIWLLQSLGIVGPTIRVR
jgi:hypothetical protein